MENENWKLKREKLKLKRKEREEFGLHKKKEASIKNADRIRSREKHAIKNMKRNKNIH